MVKTHGLSRFALKSLDEIRDTPDIILQIQETGTTFQGSGKTVYLCEVVRPAEYRAEGTLTRLSGELIAANEDNRRLRRKIERLEAALKKEREAT